MCTKHDTFPDGTEFVGKGIKPDILVQPKLVDAEKGSDPVLKAALQYLHRTSRLRPEEACT